MVNCLAGDLKEDLEAPPARKGFINILSAVDTTVMLKSTALWSLTKFTVRVSQDRLKRFISDRRAQSADGSHVTVCEFIKVRINKRVEIAQIIGFKSLTGTKQELPFLTCPIEPPKGCKKRGIGLLLNIFAIDRENRLVFDESHAAPVDIKNFVAHYEHPMSSVLH